MQISKEQQKLINKLESLVKDAKLELWNGGNIRRVRTADMWYKRPFIVNKVPYKIQLEVECKCDHQTNFTPTEIEFILCDQKNGRSYRKMNEIADYFKLSEEEVKKIYEPMVPMVKYSHKDINDCVKSYKDFLVSFKRDFLGE